ncbi:MAG: 3-keto-disaccharide hydrolase [Pirellulaceae bacterium]
MNHRPTTLAFLLIATICLTGGCDSNRADKDTTPADKPADTPETPAEPAVMTLFDGSSLEGWSGDERFWSVVDGAIVGETTPDNPIERNTFLIWQGGDVDDFELRFKYRMTGGNSGVQFRSEDKGEFSVAGYQADFDAGNNYTGILYDEGGGRGILVQRGQEVTIDEKGEKKVTGTVCDEAEYVAGLNTGDWNEVVVTAKGNRLSHSINGITSAVLIDSEEGKAKSSGILALQLHTGPPMKIEFRDIELVQTR